MLCHVFWKPTLDWPRIHLGLESSAVLKLSWKGEMFHYLKFGTHYRILGTDAIGLNFVNNLFN